jgi:tetratricopeptide (TPR) repeat protein
VLGVVVGAVALAGLLVLGAWHFFPRWFGTQIEAEGEGPGELTAADAGSATPLADAGAAGGAFDAGPATERADEGGLAGTADAGAAAAEPDAGPAPPETADAGAPPEVAPRVAYKPDAAARAAAEHGLKLLQKKRYAPALQHLGPWVKRVPQDPVLQYLYGRALFYQKKPQEAVAALEMATELNPAYADAFYELGGVYLSLKDPERARQALARFVELKPQDRRTPAVKQLLQKLR